MMFTLATAVLTAMTMTAQTDTTFAVHSGARLDVNDFGGEITVSTWGKNAVRIEAEHSPRVNVAVDQSGPNYSVRAASRHGLPARVDYRITVPSWMALSLSGVYTDVTVEGVKAEISAETVKGDVNVTGGEGFIKLSSVQGEVNVEGARGKLQISAVNEGVSIRDVIGDVSVDAVNGSVTLDQVQSDLVQAATVNGNVTYVGTLRDGGRYRFASHNGDLIVAIPANINATVSVATFSGDFESSFPIRLVVNEEHRQGKRFSFTLGSGSAVMDLETFQGTISLRRTVSLKSKEK
jgi:hypothetical protein